MRRKPKSFPPKALLGWISGICLIFFAINYSWTHAALAGVLSGNDCGDAFIERAEDALVPLFGDVEARPLIYCMDGPAAGFSVEYGSTRFAPMLPPIIVLGPRGQNIDVASHELVHAELAKRTSVLLRTYRIPTWFDEGFAMQVDTRPAFGANALQELTQRLPASDLRLADLSRPSDFFGHGERSVMHYAFANCVLRAAISEMGVEKVRQSALDVSWRSAFPTARFAAFEHRCKGGS